MVSTVTYVKQLGSSRISLRLKESVISIATSPNTNSSNVP